MHFGLTILAGAFAALTGSTPQSARLDLMPVPGGCVSEARPTRCVPSPLGAVAVAISPDGRQLYTADGYRGLGVLARNRTTGALRARACVTWRRRAGCARAPGLQNARD